MSIHLFHRKHTLLFDFPYSLIQSLEALSPGNHITVPESEQASWHSYHFGNLMSLPFPDSELKVMRVREEFPSDQ
jgi:hypothetical protein